jgi:ribosomal protein L40E
MLMAYCSNCGEKVPKDAYFCPKCGTKAMKGVEANVAAPSDELREAFAKMSQELEKAFAVAAKEIQAAFQTARENIQQSLHQEPLVCANCGEKNPSDATFCYKCGKKLEPK